MIRKHQQVLNDRQIEVLYSLGVKGKQTKSQLSYEFGVKYPAIVGTVKILEEKDMVKISGREKGVGRTKLFYELTDNGLEALSKDLRITLERFWEIAFLVFDRKTNPSVKLSVQDFFSNYEKKVLGYNLEYTPIKWSIVLYSLNLLHKPEKLSPQISVLYSLGINGPMSQQELFAYLNKTKKKIIVKSKDIHYKSKLKNMILNKLVMRIEKNKIVRYRVSILGLLLLMRYLEENYPEVSTRKKSNDFSSEIRQIFKNSKVIIPYISTSWNELREIIKEVNVMQFFKWITNDFMPNSDSIQLNGIKELLVTERIMGETNRHIIDREARIGFNVINRLFKEGRYPEGKPSEIYNRLLFLSILSGYSVKNEDRFLKSIKGAGFSLDSDIEKSIANRVCFEFFTYFIDWVIREKHMAGRIKDANDPIGKWHYSLVKKWNRFHENNREFRKWYQSWIEEIKKFEEKNLKLLKEKDFLTV